MEVQIKFWEKGVVSFPKIHDSEIFSLFFQNSKNSKKNLLIKMRAEDGTLFLLKCFEISNLSFDGLLSQNVISELEVFNKIDARERLESIRKSFHLATDKYMTELNQQILSGKKTLVYILPSVGIEGFVLCRKVALFEKDQ